MNRLRLGGYTLGIDSRTLRPVDDLLRRICRPVLASGPPLTHRLTVRGADRSGLVIDEHRHQLILTVRAGTEAIAAQIGVLQAAARGVAYLERARRGGALLHGSAFTTRAGTAVAVVDGGLGQGKTSLAVGLAHRHGRLLVDEFAFARLGPGRVLLAAAPTPPGDRPRRAALPHPGRVTRTRGPSRVAAAARRARPRHHPGPHRPDTGR